MKLMVPVGWDKYPPSSVPDSAVAALFNLASKTAAAGMVHDVLEDFRWRFSNGTSRRTSTSYDAQVDLSELMRARANNPRAFITAFIEACVDVQDQGHQAPTLSKINYLLYICNAVYQVEEERLPTFEKFSHSIGDEFVEVKADPPEDFSGSEHRLESPVRPKAFLCHASCDKAAVRVLYRRLRQDGFEPWLDEEDLLPGQDWAVEIPKAVRNSDFVVVCLSAGSIGKTGYVQKEIKLALDAADERPEGSVYIVPARLEHCVVPDRISRWHWVDLFVDSGYGRLLASLKRNTR